jgi:transcriptional regulator with PAS, ATPase and Fis domain
VIALFPDDADLVALNAVSYLGIPLLDTDDTLLGHIGIVHGAPLPPDPRREHIVSIFAGRVGAELQRLRRDGEIAARQQKLTRLLDGTVDAIVELDADRTVTQANDAALQVFGRGLVGRTFDAHLAAGAAATLRAICADVEARGRTSSVSAFLPPGLEGLDAQGRTFPLEGTLSRFESHGGWYFSLILRNVRDRVEADRRIRALTDEANELRDELDALRGGDTAIVGESPAIREVLSDVRQVAATDTTVLVTGETGTGKELVASAIHRLSTRASKRLVKVNCAAIPATLQESEFFGHEKGAFTGATQRREGRFAAADGGTLFLDEVGELPLDLQAKLLRVLQEGEFEPVGSTRTERVNVRIVAATNRDLRAMVAAGTFREDLFYRLSVFPLTLPPLRQRGTDVIAIAESILGRLRAQLGRPHVVLTPDVTARLVRYDWPGNVRELRNVLERAIITSPEGRTLNLDRALPPVAPSAVPITGELEPVAAVPADGRVLTATELRALEHANTLRALEAAGWKVSGPGGAAERLGVQPNTLTSRLKALGIRRPVA